MDTLNRAATLPTKEKKTRKNKNNNNNVRTSCTFSRKDAIYVVQRTGQNMEPELISHNASEVLTTAKPALNILKDALK